MIRVHHAWPTKLKSPRVHDELARCSDVVQGVTGVRPTAFRPPYGATNARVEAVAADLGMGKVMWNSGPSNMNAGASGILKETGKQMARYGAAGAGMVVLLHDGSGNRAGMLHALPTLIDMLKNGGWQFVRIA
ncbi:MAG: polysaccharide deacetylase family protein [Ilumatobacteraceae bacterium]